MYSDKFKWGYDGEWFNIPKEDSTFQVMISSPIGEILPFRDEMNKTAKMISDDYQGEEILLSLSGGYDSQAICLAFLNNNIKFDVATKVMKEDGRIINEEELNVSIAFSKRYNLKQSFVEVELTKRRDFYVDLAKAFYPVHWVQYSNTEVALRNKDKLVVIGNGDPMLEGHYPDVFDFEVGADTRKIHSDLGCETIDRFYSYNMNLYYASLFDEFNHYFSDTRDSMAFNHEQVTGDKYSSLLLHARYIKPLMFAKHYGNDIIHVRKLNSGDFYSKYYELKQECHDKGNKGKTNSVLITRKDWLELYNNQNIQLTFPRTMV